MGNKIRYEFKQRFVMSKIAIVMAILVGLAGAIYAYIDNEYLVQNISPAYVTEVFMPLAEYGFEQSIIQNNSSPAEGITVLLYHGLSDQNDGKNLGISDFLQQMIALKKAGYRTVTIEDLQAFIRGKKELPEKSFMITFDDGRKDSYYKSNDILKKLNYTAVMFAITEYIGTSRFYLSEKELKKMLESGRWQIESHGARAHDWIVVLPNGAKDHFLTNRLWLEQEQRFETEGEFRQRIRDDLVKSKIYLESHFNVNVLGFAYPYDDTGEKSINCPECKTIVAETVHAIYPLGFLQANIDKEDFLNHQDSSLEARRINVLSNWTASDLMNILER